MFSEIYRPRSLSEVVAQPTYELRRWGQTWAEDKPDYKSVLLYGSPGTGKTSSALALANDFHWDVLESNAAEARKGGELREILEAASWTKPNPPATHTLILIDECDQLTKTGYKALEDLVDHSVNPIVLTANNEYEIKKVTPYFRTNSLMLRYSKLNNSRIREIASKILAKENIKQPLLDKLIDNAEGDLRYVLNNLETKSVVHRRAEQTIFSIVHDIFRGEWDGDTQGIDLDFIWFAVKGNIYNFYETLYGMPTALFVAKIDMMFAHMYRNLRQGVGKESFSMWKSIIYYLRHFPMHQMTARIVIEKAPAPDPPDASKKAFARDLHMSVKKANTLFDGMPQIYNIWKKAPKSKKVDAKSVEQPSMGLFSYESHSVSPKGGVSS